MSRSNIRFYIFNNIQLGYDISGTIFYNWHNRYCKILDVHPRQLCRNVDVILG